MERWTLWYRHNTEATVADPSTPSAFHSTLEATESDWKRSILLKSNNIAHMADSWQNSQELQTQVIAEYSMHCNTYSTIYVY